jgi:hypothetical protein
VLAYASCRFRGRLSKERLQNLVAARDAVAGGPKRAVAGSGLFALSPLPSAQLFVAAGLRGRPDCAADRRVLRRTARQLFHLCCSRIGGKPQPRLGHPDLVHLAGRDRPAARCACRPRRVAPRRLGPDPYKPPTQRRVARHDQRVTDPRSLHRTLAPIPQTLATTRSTAELKFVTGELISTTSGANLAVSAAASARCAQRQCESRCRPCRVAALGDEATRRVELGPAEASAHDAPAARESTRFGAGESTRFGARRSTAR